MRKFQLTHPDITGEAFITYNADGLLVAFDAAETSMNIRHITWLLASMPREINSDITAQLTKFLEGTKCQLIEVALDVSFDTFWKAYNLPYNKKRAESSYAKLSPSEKFICIQSIKKYDKYLNAIGWQNKQHPDTYIKSKNFLTEFDKIKK